MVPARNDQKCAAENTAVRANTAVPPKPRVGAGCTLVDPGKSWPWTPLDQLLLSDTWRRPQEFPFEQEPGGVGRHATTDCASVS